MAQRVQERIDGGVQPQEPECDLVPVVRHTRTTTGGTDNHQEGVRSPANPKNADDDS